ncbi:MAG: FAD-binding protein [Flavobacteriales bacterium]|nr:FAD-binding protein [Flavobacteriales bacterium]
MNHDFKKLDQIDLDFFSEVIGKDHVMADPSDRERYGKDETEDLLFPPEVVLRPRKTDEISRIMGYCHEHSIPVTPIGALTGLSGGALSVYGGVGLSLERMNSIISIDEDNLQATVEPGVITQVFQEAVEKVGLYYPPDPASRGSCFIGGNLAENSGGPHAVKYGVTRDYVLNLEVVLPDGAVIWTGANTLKNATGYDLTHLMVGSEGTLGVITKAVFKLIPRPRLNVLLLIPFRSAVNACRAVSATFKAGIIPSAMEFMERDALDLVNETFQMGVEIPEDIEAHLLVELDGADLNVLMDQAASLSTLMDSHDCGEILFAETEAQKDKLWSMRRKVGEAVKAASIYKEEDTVVPRFQLPELLQEVKRLGEAHGFRSVCYGHAGDGNLHVNILKGDMSDEQWDHGLDTAIRDLFSFVHDLGGTISGEHGIGFVQKDYMDIVFGERQMDLMRALKGVFDPKGIMNPGKVL